TEEVGLCASFLRPGSFLGNPGSSLVIGGGVGGCLSVTTDRTGGAQGRAGGSGNVFQHKARGINGRAGAISGGVGSGAGAVFAVGGIGLRHGITRSFGSGMGERTGHGPFFLGSQSLCQSLNNLDRPLAPFVTHQVPGAAAAGNGEQPELAV